MFFHRFAKALVFLIILSASTVYADGGNCSFLFVKKKAVRGVEDFEKRSDFFSYRDHTYDFRLDAALVDGELMFFIRMVNEELNVRSLYKGTAIYDKMIKHFGVNNIREIKGIWQSGTNFNQFYENIKNGRSERDAILNTWSGRQAQKHGFTNVHYYEFVENNTPGEMPGIEAVFTRPNYRNDTD